MLLLMCTDDPDETISFELRLGKLVTELIRYFFCSMNVDTKNGLVKREGWGQQTHLSSFGLHVVT